MEVDFAEDAGGPTEVVINVSAYEYNGLHWRIVKKVDTDITDQTPGYDQMRIRYYTPGWQLAEERIDDAYDGSFGLTRGIQYYWGLRYIDDIILRRIDLDGDGAYSDASGSGDSAQRYHLTDAQFSTIAIIDETAKNIERISYSPYGEARHHNFGDVTGDGTSDSADMLVVNGSSDLTGDLNRDGVANSLDLLIVWDTEVWNVAALGYGDLTSGGGGGGEDNIIGYAGYVFDAETHSYLVRFRQFNPSVPSLSRMSPVAGKR